MGYFGLFIQEKRGRGVNRGGDAKGDKWSIIDGDPSDDND